MFGFGKKNKDAPQSEAENQAFKDGYRIGKRETQEESVKAVDGLKKDHQNEMKKLKDQVEELQDELELALQKSGASKTKVDNSKLSDKDKKKVQKTRAKLLDSLESIVRNTSAGSVRGASIVKEDGDIKMLEIHSKDEALDLIKRAKDGEIKIIM